MRKTKLTTIAHGLVIAVALLALLIAPFGGWEMTVEQPERIRFSGEYSIDKAPFQPLTENTYLNANNGTVILQGNFLRNSGAMGIQAGEHLNFYQNHIGVTIYINGKLLYDADVQKGTGPGIDADDLCGAAWHCVHVEDGIRPEDQVTVYLTNIHTFGNRNAYRQWLDELYLAPEHVFEEYQMKQAMPDWLSVGALVVFAVVLLGTALGFAMTKNPISGEMAAFGLLCLFMGGYILFSAQTLVVTSGHLILQNVGYRVCMMLLAFELCWILVIHLSGRRKQVASGIIIVLGLMDVLVALVSLTRTANFYDAAFYWLPVQAVGFLMLLIIGVWEVIRIGRENRRLLILLMLLQLAFIWELLNTRLNWTDGGMVIRTVFFILFALFLFNGTKRVISNQIKAVEVERLEQQLTENRIATMISQIQPHFIYNTLGTIEQLCLDQPEKASELVHSFSMYLRGNFTELDNLNTIRLVNEIEHVRYYTEIEKVRFPDITVQFDIQSASFSLPPLTVQPLVENAIKHGLMGLESGGTVRISTYETKHHYCVRVEDDGVGFDTSVLQDPRKHVGIRNIRARLEAMCDGTLRVESQPDVGTTATIMLPKGRREKNDRNHSR